MSYHASGRPTFRTGSIVTVPNDVRVSERYGAGISATPYSREDRNGMSVGIVKDSLRGATRTRRVKPKTVLVIRPEGETETAYERAMRLQRERITAGIIGNVE